MDRKSKILVAVFIVSVFVSIFFTYRRALVDREFTIVEEVEGNQ